jgi:preprotein translocase subunit SecA
MRELERRVVLSVIDRRWRDHLYEMDYLKDGIGLRAMAQRDPLIEYQREGYAMFQSMMGQIKEESVGYLYNLEVEVRRAGDSDTAEVEAKGLASDGGEQRLEYSAANDAGEVEVRNDRGQVQQAATDRVRQAAARAQAPQPEPEEAPRGAFGQRTEPAAPAAGNREQRRAQGKKKK